MEVKKTLLIGMFMLALLIGIMGFASADDNSNIYSHQWIIDHYTLINKIKTYFSGEEFSIVGTYRHCSLTPEKTGSVYPGTTETISASSYCSSGSGLIDVYLLNGDVTYPYKEFIDKVTLPDQPGYAKLTYIYEIYCCPHPQCTSDSNCVTWYGTGSKCLSSTTGMDKGIMLQTPWKYCSEPSLGNCETTHWKTCGGDLSYYIDNWKEWNGVQCVVKQQTYPCASGSKCIGSGTCKTCGDYTTKICYNNQVALKNSCDEVKISATQCTTGTHCHNGECISDTPTGCSKDSDCDSGYTCVSGGCVEESSGTSGGLLITLTQEEYNSHVSLGDYNKIINAECDETSECESKSGNSTHTAVTICLKNIEIWNNNWDAIYYCQAPSKLRLPNNCWGTKYYCHLKLRLPNSCWGTKYGAFMVSPVTKDYISKGTCRVIYTVKEVEPTNESTNESTNEPTSTRKFCIPGIDFMQDITKSTDCSVNTWALIIGAFLILFLLKIMKVF